MRGVLYTRGEVHAGGATSVSPYCVALCAMAFLAPASAGLCQSSDWTVDLDRRTLTALPSGEVWNHEQQSFTDASGDRWTVRRTLPLDTPLALSRPDAHERDVSVTWRHDWTALHETSPSGLELSLSPHAGIDWHERGSSAVAGATLRVGRGLDRIAPNGDARFGQKARWYLFASGSKRAIGYNFMRHRDGGISSEGLSNDLGQSALGDAAVGIAWRKGPIQSTVGLAYREVDIQGLRGYDGLRTDVDEGRLAFQLTIRPQ